jgi:hypothetical protein
MPEIIQSTWRISVTSPYGRGLLARVCIRTRLITSAQAMIRVVSSVQCKVGLRMSARGESGVRATEVMRWDDTVSYTRTPLKYRSVRKRREILNVRSNLVVGPGDERPSPFDRPNRPFALVQSDFSGAEPALFVQHEASGHAATDELAGTAFSKAWLERDGTHWTSHVERVVFRRR